MSELILGETNMYEYETTTVTPIFPFVSFVSVAGKDFCLPRENILHTETFSTKDEHGNEVLDHTKTFVNFTSPNPNSKGALHTTVDMPVKLFRSMVLRPAWEGASEDKADTTS